MAYPDDLLSENEHVVVHNHPHFKMLIAPFFALVVTLGLGIWLAILGKGAAAPWDLVSLIAIAVVALVLIVWLFFAPFVRWRTTHFIVTTDRVMAREGVIKRTGIDIPLSRVSSVRFEHGLIADHRDDFDFTRWARQAIGIAGLLPPVRAAVRKKARAGLDEFIARGG